MYFPSNPVFPVPNTYPRIYPRFAVMSQRPPWKCSIFGGLYKQSKQIREGGREGERERERLLVLCRARLVDNHCLVYYPWI